MAKSGEEGKKHSRSKRLGKTDTRNQANTVQAVWDSEQSREQEKRLGKKPYSVWPDPPVLAYLVCQRWLSSSRGDGSTQCSHVTVKEENILLFLARSGRMQTEESRALQVHILAPWLQDSIWWWGFWKVIRCVFGHENWYPGLMAWMPL